MNKAREMHGFTTLWSWRWTTSRGWLWCLERRCDATNSAEWLEVYQKDEPNVHFELSENQPKGRG